MAPTESPAPVKESGTRSDSSSAPAVISPQPAAGGFRKPSHWNDQAARMYRTAKASDPVAEKSREAADAAEKARQTAAREAEAAAPKPLTETLPANVAALRASDPMVYPSTFDEALGLRTKDFIEIKTQDGDVLRAATPELALVRTGIAGMAHDMGLEPADLASAVGIIRATRAGNPIPTDTVSDIDKADAQALMSRDPRVAGLLNHLGVANHPWIVAKFASLAREQRARGRLQ